MSSAVLRHPLHAGAEEAVHLEHVVDDAALSPYVVDFSAASLLAG